MSHSLLSQNRRIPVTRSPKPRKQGLGALGLLVPQMSGAGWSVFRRLTDSIWMPLLPLLGGVVIWMLNAGAQQSAIRAYDLDRVERVVLKQCWTRVVELAPQSETIARRTPQDVCGCAVAGLRQFDRRDVSGGLLGDAVHSRRLWIEPRAWSPDRVAGVVGAAASRASVSPALIDHQLEMALEGCD